jgi:hypothetical protein
MSNRNYTITYCGTGNLDDIDPELEGLIDGLKAAGHYFASKFTEPSGPEAVDAPALNVLGGNQVRITNPNFTVEDGVEYSLQTSEDGESWTTLADNQGPNDENVYVYTATTRFRIVASGKGESTPGPKTPPIS